MAEEKTEAHVGYHPKKGAETFHLKAGEKLPEGYSSRPHPGQHPHDAEQGREAKASER